MVGSSSQGLVEVVSKIIHRPLEPQGSSYVNFFAEFWLEVTVFEHTSSLEIGALRFFQREPQVAFFHQLEIDGQESSVAVVHDAFFVVAIEVQSYIEILVNFKI